MPTNPSRSICLAAAVTAACLLGQPAQAAVAVVGTGNARVCSLAAQRLPKTQADIQHAIEACDTALSAERLDLHDQAGSHINRGILLTAQRDYANAMDDFDAAIHMMPGLGEGYVDRGAIQLAMKRYADAIADIDQGLARNTAEPEKAYFDRGLAREALDDIQGAYHDYLRAAQLKPDWSQPRIELTRFTVLRAGRAT
jgi:tetratricopeptide (TPR) repeat protein